MKFYEEDDATKKKRGRPPIFTAEERKARKREYDLSYQKKRYKEDPEFRERNKKNQKSWYLKNTEKENI